MFKTSFILYYIIEIYKCFNFIIRYVGLCGGIKIIALGIFLVDWWLVRKRKSLEYCSPLDPNKDITGSIKLPNNIGAGI